MFALTGPEDLSRSLLILLVCRLSVVFCAVAACLESTMCSVMKWGERVKCFSQIGTILTDGFHAWLSGFCCSKKINLWPGHQALTLLDEDEKLMRIISVIQMIQSTEQIGLAVQIPN